MAIRFNCPFCKTVYTSVLANSGKPLTCSGCGQVLKVPSTSRGMAYEDEPPPFEPDAIRHMGGAPPQSPVPGKQRMPRNYNAVLVIIYTCIVVTFFSSGVFALVWAIKRTSSGDRRVPSAATAPSSSTASTASTATVAPATTNQEPLAGEVVYQRLVHCTVLILAKNSYGSGVIIDRDRRFVLTNYHVVDELLNVDVVFPIYDAAGNLVTELSSYHNKIKRINARVIARDPSRDIALIQLAEMNSKAVAVEFAPKHASTGNTVYSVGSSGLKENLLWRLTKGIVRGRSVRQVPLPGFQVNCMVLETDAPLNPGDSGGPLVNDRAELVALISHGSEMQQQVSGNIDLDEIRAFIKPYINK